MHLARRTVSETPLTTFLTAVGLVVADRRSRTVSSTSPPGSLPASLRLLVDDDRLAPDRGQGDRAAPAPALGRRAAAFQLVAQRVAEQRQGDAVSAIARPGHSRQQRCRCRCSRRRRSASRPSWARSVAQAEEFQAGLDRDRDAATHRGLDDRRRRTTHRMCRPMIRASLRPEDPGGVDVQLVPHAGDRAETRRKKAGAIRTPKTSMAPDRRAEHGPTASSTMMPGSAISRLATSDARRTSACRSSRPRGQRGRRGPRRRPGPPWRPTRLIRVPNSSRDQMSWPEPSAPSRSSPLGGASMSRAARAFGSSVPAPGRGRATTTSSSEEGRTPPRRVLQQPPEQRRGAVPPAWRRRVRRRRAWTRS